MAPQRPEGAQEAFEARFLSLCRCSRLVTASRNALLYANVSDPNDPGPKIAMSMSKFFDFHSTTGCFHANRRRRGVPTAAQPGNSSATLAK